MGAGDSLQFAAAVRAISSEARRLGLEVPGFRSPPRIPSDRSLRRRAGAAPAVAVRLGRPIEVVVGDLVEGVVVVNGLGGPRADSVRQRLFAAVAA